VHFPTKHINGAASSALPRATWLSSAQGTLHSGTASESVSLSLFRLFVPVPISTSAPRHGGHLGGIPTPWNINVCGARDNEIRHEVGHMCVVRSVRGALPRDWVVYVVKFSIMSGTESQHIESHFTQPTM
jgi:hypothetical protein